MKNFEIPTSWKGIKGLEEAKRLVDYGILLPWKEAKQMKKKFPLPDQVELVRHFAVRLGERVESRLPEEILIESVLVYLANCQEEEILYSFLEELLLHPNNIDACLVLTELAISLDLSTNENADDIFAMAVALVCELGVAVREVGIKYTEESESVSKVLDHVSTYLLSVSNSSSPCIRLSLVHYFGVVEQGKSNKPGFNRVMGRFGHTVLEHLFLLLFNKKTENVSLQYLMENLPFVLEADNHCQSILHQTFKFYMLKKPERFALFLHTFATHVRNKPGENTAVKRVFLQHLGVLLKVVSEVNHKSLARELLIVILSFEGEAFKDELISLISVDETIRPSFKQLLEKMLKGIESGIDISGAKGAAPRTKRGRKPSFSKGEALKSIHQVAFLGHKYTPRAS